jgi:hypothetical protein
MMRQSRFDFNDNENRYQFFDPKRWFARSAAARLSSLSGLLRRGK